MAPIAHAAAAAVLLACVAAAGAVQVPKCEWAAEYWLCVATRAAAFPKSPNPPSRLSAKDIEVWARESLCAAKDTKEACDAALKPGKDTTDPCFWDDEQKFCRGDVDPELDVACSGDLAELTNKCASYDKEEPCVKDSLCTWENVNGKEICYPQKVNQMGIKTVPAFYIHYYYNPETYGDCDASKKYREFLKTCWGKSKEECAKNPSCKFWPNEGLCSMTEVADSAYVTGNDQKSVGAEKECAKLLTKDACLKAGSTSFDAAAVKKFLEDSAPVPGLTSFDGQ